MASDPRIRASDADRDRTAALLREHHAAGRLTADEFNERLDKAYAAKTLGELDELLADLPGIDLYQLPDAGWSAGAVARRAHAAAVADGARIGRPHLRRPGGPPGIVAVGEPGRFPGLAAQRGHPGNLWFLWVAGPYGVILLGRWISGDLPRRDRRRRE